MKAKDRSKAATETVGIPTVHVPVSTGECVVIPERDLEDFRRYAWWSRVFPNLITNSAWERLFAKILPARYRDLNEETFGEFVVLFPYALSLRYVSQALVDAALDCDQRPFRAISDALAREASKRRRDLGEQTEEAVHRIHTAAKQIGPAPSRRAAISRASGGAYEGDSRFEKLSAGYKRFVNKARTYPRVRRVSVEGDDHAGQTDELIAGSILPSASAPALYLGPEDHPTVAKGEIPPGEPVLAPRYGRGWGTARLVDGEIEIHFFEQPRIPIARDHVHTKPRGRD